MEYLRFVAIGRFSDFTELSSSVECRVTHVWHASAWTRASPRFDSMKRFDRVACPNF